MPEEHSSSQEPVADISAAPLALIGGEELTDALPIRLDKDIVEQALHRIALQRNRKAEIEARLATQPVEAQRKFDAAVEAYTSDPKSYAQFTVKYLLEHKDDIVRQIQHEYGETGTGTLSAQQLTRVLASDIIYPAVAPQIIFEDCDRWVPQNTFSGDRTSVGIFVRNVLNDFIADLIQRYRGELEQMDEVNITNLLLPINGQGAVEASEENFFGIAISPLKHSIAFPKMNLMKILDTLACGVSNGLVKDKTPSNYKHRDVTYYGEFSIPNKDRSQFTATAVHCGAMPDRDNQPPPKTETFFNNVGLYIYNRIKKSSIHIGRERNVNTRDPAQISRFIDDMITSLSGIQKEEPPAKEAVYSRDQLEFPSLDEHKNLKRQIITLMLKRAIDNGWAVEDRSKLDFDKGEVPFFFKLVGDLEKRSQGAVQKKLEEYAKISGFRAAKKKKEFRDNLDKEEVIEDVEGIYELMWNAYQYFETGKMYSTSTFDDQKNVGALYMELGQMILEMVKRGAIQFETKIKFHDFEADSIKDAVQKTGHLFGAAGVRELTEKALAAAFEIQTAVDAADIAHRALQEGKHAE